MSGAQPLTEQVLDALRFIAAVRDDTALHARISDLDPVHGLAAVVAIAGSAGYPITEQALRVAHANDWSMRWVRYSMAANATNAVAAVNKPSSST